MYKFPRVSHSGLKWNTSHNQVYDHDSIKLMSNILPLNFSSQTGKSLYQKTMRSLPEYTEVYLVGGSVRNALMRHFHNKILTQRDYDQIVTKGSAKYLDYLESLDYIEHPYPNRSTQTVYVKSLVPHPNKDGYDDWLVFDIHIVDGTTAIDNLKEKSGFTINGFAIKADDVLSKPWEDILISLPNAVEDIKNKQLRLNYDGYKDQPANLFAMIRFVYAGFKAPSPNEIGLLLNELHRVDHERWQRNVKKVFDYVGGEKTAKSLVRRLGIDIDIFNEKEVKGSAN